MIAPAVLRGEMPHTVHLIWVEEVLHELPVRPDACRGGLHLWCEEVSEPSTAGWQKWSEIRHKRRAEVVCATIHWLYFSNR